MQRLDDMQVLIGAERVAGTLRAIAIAAAVILAVWLLSDIVLLIFLAVLIAVILRGIANWASHHTGIGERLMLAIVTLIIFALMAGFLIYLGPRLTSEAQDLWKTLQQQIGAWREQYGDTGWGRLVFQQLSPSQAMQGNVSKYVGSAVTFTFGGLLTGFVLMVTALYFAISPMLYVNGVVRLFPLRYRPHALHVMLDIGSTLRWWSLGQLIDMAVVGVITGVGLSLLGIPLALALGVLAGLFTFVPYFGTIASAIPAIAVALTQGWQAALWVLVIFLVAHGIEGYIVSPLVQRRTVELPPALTILSMTVLEAVFGPLGVILGTPVAAVLLVSVREAYVGQVLGDPEIAGPTEG